MSCAQRSVHGFLRRTRCHVICKRVALPAQCWAAHACGWRRNLPEASLQQPATAACFCERGRPPRSDCPWFAMPRCLQNQACERLGGLVGYKAHHIHACIPMAAHRVDWVANECTTPDVAHQAPVTPARAMAWQHADIARTKLETQPARVLTRPKPASSAHAAVTAGARPRRPRRARR